MYAHNSDPSPRSPEGECKKGGKKSLVNSMIISYRYVNLPPSGGMGRGPQKFGYPNFEFKNLSPSIVHVMYVRTFFCPFSE